MLRSSVRGQNEDVARPEASNVPQTERALQSKNIDDSIDWKTIIPNIKWVPLVANGVATTIGFSRVTLSAHNVSDVFAGTP